LAVAIAVLALKVISKFTIEHVTTSWLVHVTLIYWPFFALGLLSYGLPQLWSRLHQPDPLLIALALTLIVLNHAVFPDGQDTLRAAFDRFTWAIGLCAALFTLLWLFKRHGDFDTPATRFLSRSIYSVYLFHYLLIYILAHALAGFDLEPLALYLLIVLGTYLIAFSLHHWVIERSSVLSLLFNGKKIEAPGARPVRNS
jgi:glucan biosynthesis protein C